MQLKQRAVKRYFDHTDAYITDNLVIRLRTKILEKFLSKLDNKEILDIGCGNGEITLPYILFNKITFLDISDSMLELVRRRIPECALDNAEIINCDFESFNPDKKYDYLIMLGVLAHVDSIDNTILKLSELRKDNSIIVLQYTNSRNLISIFLRIIAYLKGGYFKKYGYKMNYSSSNDLYKVLNKYRLKCYNRISYWPALPGFKLLPRGIREYLYLKILNSNMLQFLGGEKILFISANLNQ